MKPFFESFGILAPFITALITIVYAVNAFDERWSARDEKIAVLEAKMNSISNQQESMNNKVDKILFIISEGRLGVK